MISMYDYEHLKRRAGEIVNTAWHAFCWFLSDATRLLDQPAPREPE